MLIARDAVLVYLHSSYALARVTLLNPGMHSVVSALDAAAIGCHKRCNVIRRHFNRNINSSSREGSRTRVRSRRVATATLSSSSLIDFCNRLAGQFIRKLRLFRAADNILRDTQVSSVIVIFFIGYPDGSVERNEQEDAVRDAVLHMQNYLIMFCDKIT